MQHEELRKIKARRDAFASIAFWQSMAFVFLLGTVWGGELLDAPEVIFHAEPTPFSWFRVLFLSTAVIASGVVVVGHTYEQQRTLLKKLLKTCIYCHRVETPSASWEYVEDYFVRHYPVAMQRGACPSCEKMLAELAAEQERFEQRRAVVIPLDR